MDRARLTPVDVVFYAVALFLLAIMVQPVYTLLAAKAGDLSKGVGLLMQIVFPLLILSIFTVIYATSASGGAR